MLDRILIYWNWSITPVVNNKQLLYSITDWIDFRNSSLVLLKNLTSNELDSEGNFDPATTCEKISIVGCNWQIS